MSWSTSYPPASLDPPVGNRHSSGINLLWADMHVSWMSQTVLRGGSGADEDWYYKMTK